MLDTLPRCSRAQAWELARDWCQRVTDPQEFLHWSSVTGLRRPEAARELLDHHFTADVLERTAPDGVPVRSRLRNGDDIEVVIAAIYRVAAVKYRSHR
ncbi:hypothetical protein [Streptomyces sp. NPDC051561]|uniref:hypothetical protein n=1 Tax=Streptomyces sp. NPDC051561 TaxID=3365658 RepID=UPI0037AE0054